MYELYSIHNGVKQVTFASEDSLTVRKTYAIMKATHANVRVSINGRQMTISEADKWCGSEHINRASTYMAARREEK